MTGTPGSSYHLELFANAGPDAGGNWEGETLVGSTSVTLDSTGSFIGVVPTGLPAGLPYYTITLTDANGNTSQFSQQTAQVLPPASLSGIVWEDFNDDGQVDFGEQGISGVTITLTGTDDLGRAVNQSQVTDSAGAYVFLNLRPGSYYITETPPTGYVQGIDTRRHGRRQPGGRGRVLRSTCRRCERVQLQLRRAAACRRSGAGRSNGRHRLLE